MVLQLEVTEEVDDQPQMQLGSYQTLHLRRHCCPLTSRNSIYNLQKIKSDR